MTYIAYVYRRVIVLEGYRGGGIVEGVGMTLVYAPTATILF